MIMNETAAMYAVETGYRGGTESDHRPATAEESARLIVAVDRSAKRVKAIESAIAAFDAEGISVTDEQSETLDTLRVNHSTLVRLAEASAGFPVTIDGSAITPRLFVAKGFKSTVLRHCKAIIGQ